MSADQPWIFVRIAKTGSTSVRRVIGPDPAIKIRTHAPAALIRETMPEAYNKAFTFSFVRNPWDRVVSLWHYRGKPRTFDDWAHAQLGDREGCFGQFGQYVSCWKMVSDGNASIVDYVGRFETIGTDFAEVCGRIGMKPRKLPHLNKAEDRVDYHDYYKGDLADLVSGAYADDVRHFRYEF